MDTESIMWQTDKNAFRFFVEISQDDDGIYSVVALNLPGVGSCAKTVEEALRNFEEAASGVLGSYLDSTEKIPWSEIPGGQRRVVVVVRVG